MTALSLYFKNSRLTGHEFTIVVLSPMSTCEYSPLISVLRGYRGNNLLKKIRQFCRSGTFHDGDVDPIQVPSPISTSGE